MGQLRALGTMDRAPTQPAAVVDSSPTSGAGSCSKVIVLLAAYHKLQRGRLKPDSTLLSNLQLQIRTEWDFWTLFLVLGEARFCLCEIGLEVRSHQFPQIVQHLNKELFLPYQPLSYAYV